MLYCHQNSYLLCNACRVVQGYLKFIKQKNKLSLCAEEPQANNAELVRKNLIEVFKNHFKGK